MLRPLGKLIISNRIQGTYGDDPTINRTFNELIRNHDDIVNHNLGVVNVNNLDYNYTPLTLAIDYNNTNAINKLFNDKTIDVNKVDNNNFTPLTLAVRHVPDYGTIVLEELLRSSDEKNLDFEQKDGNNHDVFYYIDNLENDNDKIKTIRIILLNIRDRIKNTTRIKKIKNPDAALSINEFLIGKRPKGLSSNIANLIKTDVPMGLPDSINVEVLKPIFGKFIIKLKEVEEKIRQDEEELLNMMNNNGEVDGEEWVDIPLPSQETTINSNTGIPSSTTSISSSTKSSEDVEPSTKKRKREGGRKTLKKGNRTKKHGSPKILRHKTKRMSKRQISKRN